MLTKNLLFNQLSSLVGNNFLYNHDLVLETLYCDIVKEKVNANHS